MIHANLTSHSYRDNTVDIIRGIAILLVVIGHTIQYNTHNFDDNIVFKLIYSFHMPLFMFISGYVLAIHPPKLSNMNFIAKKFNQLVIPFLVWYFCIAYFANNQFVSVDFFDYAKRLIISPAYGYWFLWILFINFIIFSGISATNQHVPEWFTIILVILIIKFLPTFYFGHVLVKLYLPFFFGGYLFAKYKNNIVRLSYKKYIPLFYVLFLFLLYFWTRTTPSPIIELIHIQFSKNMIFHLNELYHFVTSFIGIFLIFDITNRFLLNFKYSNYLSLLGTNYTLDIYVIHIYFISLISWISFYPAMILINAISALIISLITSYFIRKNYIFSYLLLGIKNSKSSFTK